MSKDPPCSITERDALDCLLSKLTRWEESHPVYQEMLRSADARKVRSDG